MSLFINKDACNTLVLYLFEFIDVLNFIDISLFFMQIYLFILKYFIKNKRFKNVFLNDPVLVLYFRTCFIINTLHVCFVFFFRIKYFL